MEVHEILNAACAQWSLDNFVAFENAAMWDHRFNVHKDYSQDYNMTYQKFAKRVVSDDLATKISQKLAFEMC